MRIGRPLQSRPDQGSLIGSDELRHLGSPVVAATIGGPRLLC